MLEHDAFCGKAVQVGRKGALGSEKAHAVGAGGVEGDQHQVGFGCGRGEGESKK